VAQLLVDVEIVVVAAVCSNGSSNSTCAAANVTVVVTAAARFCRTGEDDAWISRLIASVNAVLSFFQFSCVCLFVLKWSCKLETP